MAPALRMTRSIKEKLPIFLPLFCPLPSSYVSFWGPGWGDRGGGRKGWRVDLEGFFGRGGVGLMGGLAYLRFEESQTEGHESF